MRCPNDEEPGERFYSYVAQARWAHANVVIDWGFPVTAISSVQDLIASGVQQWWFDGDRDAAFQSFSSRNDHPGSKADWDSQLADIEREWTAISNLFADRVVLVVAAGEAGPVHMANADRFELLRRAAANPRSGSV